MGISHTLSARAQAREWGQAGRALVGAEFGMGLVGVIVAACWDVLSIGAAGPLR